MDCICACCMVTWNSSMTRADSGTFCSTSSKLPTNAHVICGCTYCKCSEARAQYLDAMNTTGYQADLAYNVALCHYKERSYAAALKSIGEVIERGVREHPELSVGSNTDGIDVRSVGNSAVLAETCLVEAFNLKAAIEYCTKNMDAAREALSDMPPR